MKKLKNLFKILFLLFVILISINCDESSGDFSINPSTDTSVNYNNNDYSSINVEENYEDQPTSGERFVAIHVAALGAKEELKPTLVGLDSMATKYLPHNYVLKSVLSATREIVHGVKYELNVEVFDDIQSLVVCNLQILETPWITNERGDKQTNLIYSNCSQEESSGFKPEVNFDDNIKYHTNKIFDRDNRYNNELTEERLKNLESLIIVPIAAEKFKRPVLSQNTNDGDEIIITSTSPSSINSDLTENDYETTSSKLSKDTLKFLDDFFSSDTSAVKIEETNLNSEPNNPNQLEEEFVRVDTPLIKQSEVDYKIDSDQILSDEPTSSTQNILSTENDNLNINKSNRKGDEQVASVFNEYLNSELVSTDTVNKLGTEDEEVAMKFKNIMQNFDEHMKREGIDIDAIRKSEQFNNRTGKSDENKNDNIKMNEENLNNENNNNNNNNKETVIIKEDIIQTESSVDKNENNDQNNEESNSRKKRSTSLNTERDYINSIVNRALKEIDRFDSDNKKRVALDVISFKSIDNTFIFMLRIADSNCLEDEKMVNDCIDKTIDGSNKYCLIEVDANKNNIKVTKSECVPEKPIHVDTKRSTETNEQVGGVAATSDDDKKFINNIIKTSLTKISSGDNDVDYFLLKILDSKKQIVSGVLYTVQVNIGNRKNENEIPITCKITIWNQPWKHEDPEVKFDCDNKKTYTFRKKRAASDNEIIDGGLSEVDDLNDLMEMIHESIPVLNTQIDGYEYKFSNLLKANEQIVSGILYRIDAELIEKDKNTNTEKKINSHIKIWDQPWLNRQVDFNLNNKTKIKFVMPEKRQTRQIQVPGGVFQIYPIYNGESTIGTDQENELVFLLQSTVPELNNQNSDKEYSFSKIHNATEQIVSGSLYRINAQYNRHQKSSNTKDLVDCFVEIWDQPWLPNGRRVTYKCENDEEYKYNINSVRRVKRRLRGGSKDIDVNDIEASKKFVSLAEDTLPELNAKYPDFNYKFVRLVTASQQVVTGTLYRMRIDLNPLTDSNLIVSCNIRIWDQPVANERRVNYDCENGHTVSFTSNSIKRTKRSTPPGGTSSIDVNSDKAKEMIFYVQSSLPQFTSVYNGHEYKFVKLISASKQVVSGHLYRINAEFTHKDDSNTESTVACDIEIWDQPWIKNGRKVKYNCNNGHVADFSMESVRYSERTKRSPFGLVGGPEPIDINSGESKEMIFYVESTLPKFSSQYNDQRYTFSKLISATKQVVSGVLYKIEADLTHTNEKNQETTVNCNIEVWDQPWLPQGRNVKYNCNNGHTANFNTESVRYSERSKRSPSDKIVGGISPIDINSEETKEMTFYIQSTLPEFRSKFTGHDYTFLKINSASRQVVSGILYRIQTDLVHKDDKEVESTVTCDVEIWDQPWIKNGRKVKYNCNNGHNADFSTESVRYTSKSKRSVKSNEDDEIHDIHKFRDYTLDEAMHNNLSDHRLFTLFKDLYNKSYQKSMEHSMRFKIFRNNLRLIRELNMFEQGTAKYGITEFADLTSSEFRLRTGLLKKHHTDRNELPNAQAEIPNFKLPREFDWREKGVVSHVKDQGNCGSCWAFSVVGNIEGLHAIKTGQMEEYSEQELLDCDDIDHACNGGIMDDAYKAIEQIGGLEIESDYPYKARQGRCNLDKNKIHIQVSGGVDLPKNETAMALWLLQNGPISIGINANAMQFYRGGVSHPWRILCTHSNLDHGVLIVGFGVHEYPKFNKVLPYWIVKNSWGPHWGEQGYYRVYRGDNTCGVANMATSAVLA